MFESFNVLENISHLCKQWINSQAKSKRQFCASFHWWNLMIQTMEKVVSHGWMNKCTIQKLNKSSESVSRLKFKIWNLLLAPLTSVLLRQCFPNYYVQVQEVCDCFDRVLQNLHHFRVTVEQDVCCCIVKQWEEGFDHLQKDDPVRIWRFDKFYAALIDQDFQYTKVSARRKPVYAKVTFLWNSYEVS